MAAKVQGIGVVGLLLLPGLLAPLLSMLLTEDFGDRRGAARPAGMPAGFPFSVRPEERPMREDSPASTELARAAALAGFAIRQRSRLNGPERQQLIRAFRDLARLGRHEGSEAGTDLLLWTAVGLHALGARSGTK